MVDVIAISAMMVGITYSEPLRDRSGIESNTSPHAKRWYASRRGMLEDRDPGHAEKSREFIGNGENCQDALCCNRAWQATGKTIWSPAIPNLNESLLAKKSPLHQLRPSATLPGVNRLFTK